MLTNGHAGELADRRAAPSNVEAEQALLGAILINNIAYRRVASLIAREHFSLEVHGRIFAALGVMIEADQPADVVMLKRFFDKDGALGEVGGAQYLGRLAASAVTIVNAPWYAEAIVDAAHRRAMILAGADLVDAAHTPEMPIDDTVSTLLLRLPRPRGQLSFTCAADIADIPAPERPWLVADWIPHRQVTLLSGDGGGGKSTIAMQLQVAAAAGVPWLGLNVDPCRSLAVYAEDDEDELHRRLRAIASLMAAPSTALRDMQWRCAVGDNAELVSVDETGAVKPTPYFRLIERATLDFGARLLILDAVTNLYGADEIKRRQVNGFIGLLRQLAIRMDGSILLLAHPSAQGIATGSGISGSTHWNNAVRSRLYLTRTTGEDANPDERDLSRLKANYAAGGDSLRLLWQRGAFITPAGLSSLDRTALAAKAERVFLDLLASTYCNGAWTSATPTARNYAPFVFSQHPDREQVAKSHLETAMLRLIQTDRIKTEPYGPPSRDLRRIAPV